MASLASPGVVNVGDMLVSPASGLQVQIAAGSAYVQQTVAVLGAAYEGLYFEMNDAAANPYNNISAPISNPRIDQVVLRVYDVPEQGLSGSSFARFEWLTGTETSGATITPGTGYLAGAAALTANSLRLSYVQQNVSESSISSGQILNVAPLSGGPLGSGTLAQRPLSARQGAFYYATDTALTYQYAGTAWLPNTGWVALGIPSGFSSGAAYTFAPAYKWQGNTVRMRGSVENTSGSTYSSGTVIVNTFPPPSSSVVFSAPQFTTSFTNFGISGLLVTGSGIEIFGSSTLDNGYLQSLDGIQYDLA